MQRAAYVGGKPGTGDVPVGAMVYAAASPGAQYELANAAVTTLYSSVSYPALAKACYGRTGTVLEASTVNSAGFASLSCQFPGGDNYVNLQDGGAISKRAGFNGAWSSLASLTLGGGNRPYGAWSLTTKVVVVGNAGGVAIIHSLTSGYVFSTSGAVHAGEGNGRIILAGSNQLGWIASSATSGSPTWVAATGGWCKVFYCGGNNWVAFATDGKVAKSTDNGNSWTVTPVASITGAGAIQNSSWYAYGSDYAITYDPVVDKFYISTGGVVKVASFATVTTTWTTELSASPDRLRTTTNYILATTASGLYACRRGTTTWRMISAAVFATGSHWCDLSEQGDGYITAHIADGSPCAYRIGDGINMFEPPRDLNPGWLLPYLKIR